MTLLVFTACNPKIYSYDVSPHVIAQTDPVTIKWQLKGRGVLLIHDIPYPGTTAALHDAILLVMLDGKQATYTLSPNDTLRIPVPAEDSLTIREQPNDQPESRLRYLTLVASLNGNEAPATVQVEVRQNKDSDVIAFTTKQLGDSLLAAGENSAERWGDNFAIGTVTAGSNRLLVVTHGGITQVLRPGDNPNNAFRGTPVRGAWSISSPMTAGEKNGSQRTPPFLKITITIISR